MPDVDLNEVSTLVFSLGMIYLELFGQNACFDPSLMQNDFLKPRYAGNGIGDSVSPSNERETSSMWFDSFQTLSAKPKLSKISRLLHCKPSAWPLKTFVPLLSTILACTPHLAA